MTFKMLWVQFKITVFTYHISNTPTCTSILILEKALNNRCFRFPVLSQNRKLYLKILNYFAINYEVSLKLTHLWYSTYILVVEDSSFVTLCEDEQLLPIIKFLLSPYRSCHYPNYLSTFTPAVAIFKMIMILQTVCDDKLA